MHLLLQTHAWFCRLLWSQKGLSNQTRRARARSQRSDGTPESRQGSSSGDSLTAVACEHLQQSCLPLGCLHSVQAACQLRQTQLHSVQLKRTLQTPVEVEQHELAGFSSPRTREHFISPEDCGPACLQHVLGTALTQLGVPVCADGVCYGLQQTRRGAVVHQCVAAQVSCLTGLQLMRRGQRDEQWLRFSLLWSCLLDTRWSKVAA